MDKKDNTTSRRSRKRRSTEKMSATMVSEINFLFFLQLFTTNNDSIDLTIRQKNALMIFVHLAYIVFIYIHIHTFFSIYFIMNCI